MTFQPRERRFESPPQGTQIQQLEAQTNAFLSRSWLEMWQRTSRFGKSLFFLDGGEQFGIVTLSKALRLYANGGLNRTNLIDSRQPEELVQRVRAHLHRGVLLLFDVPGDGELARFLERQGRQSVRLYPSPLIRLNGSFSSYIEAQFSPHNRHEFRRRFRRLNAVGDVQFRVFNDPDEVRELVPLLDRFFALLAERFDREKAEYNFYSTPRGQTFIRGLVQNLLGKGMAVPVISLDGVPISFSLCYLVDERVVAAMAPYDIAFSKFGLGQLHLWNTLAWSVENGYKVFDLSKGWAPYKRLWANDETWLSLYILPLSDSTQDRFLSKLVEYFFRGVVCLRQCGAFSWLKRARAWMTGQFAGFQALDDKNRVSFTESQDPHSSQIGGRLNYFELAEQPIDVRRRIVDAAFNRWRLN